MPERERTGVSGLLDQLPTDRLAEQGQQLLVMLAERAIERAVGSVEGLADRLIDYSHHGGPGLIAAITGGTTRAPVKPPIGAALKTGVAGVSGSVKRAFSAVSGPGKSGRVIRTMNIVEQIDVGVPVRLAYDQWSQFQDFSQFMKKVSAVEKTSDEASSWKVQVAWSHRAWDATIVEQIPDERIVWRSDGAKGPVDGIVSFHTMAPNMTRILLVLEYHPQGLLERTGGLWHAQSRRVRSEIEQFRRHALTRAFLDPDSVQGWRGEIRDGKVVRTHEEAIAAEARERGESHERIQPPDAPGEDDLDPTEKDDNVDDPVEEAEERGGDYDDADDTYDDDLEDDADDDPGDDPEDDDPDDDYEDESERAAVRSGGNQ